MIMLIIIIFKTHQTLIYEFNATSNVLDGWECQNSYNFNTYQGIHYFGSSNINRYEISRIFLDLDPHSHIIVDAQFLIIDNTYQPYIYIDFQQQSNQFAILPQNYIFSGAQPEYLRTISITHQHNRRTIWISINQQYGGLISLKLKCSGCIDNYHANCQEWKLHQYSFNQKNFTYSDGWTFELNQGYYFQCGNCQFLKISYIKYKTQLPPHKDYVGRKDLPCLEVAHPYVR
ncbi:unnamed protein product, partial (macronuclear) [Paramecium tetraurelia]